jgi:pimeloyl-ACP methyl ester carboxylesterase
MPKEKMSDVIVLLPGLMGSILSKGGKDIWTASVGSLLSGVLTGGGRFKDLILREDPPGQDDLGDGVVASKVMPDVHMIPGLWKIDGYSKVGKTIKDTFDVTEGQNYFEFPYDWRRDARVSARRLDRQARGWLERWRTSSGRADARLILIGHSMGGIVSRYFLEGLEGWRVTRALVTFGTPYRGSLNAVDTLVNGVKKGPFGIMDLTELARSLTSVYQLIPLYPCYDAGDGRLVRIGETTGIPNIDAAKAAAGLAFYHEIRDKVEAHRAMADYREHGYETYPIVGIRQPTRQSARRAGAGVDLLESYEGTDQSGDGTVPRVSATPVELSDAHREMYAATRHGSLQNADAVLTNLIGLLSGFSLGLGDFRGPARPGPAPIRLGLRIEDAYWPDEPISVVVRPERDVALRCVVAETSSGREVAQATLASTADGAHRADLAPLPPGAYRVTVSGAADVEPVADVFAVMTR